MQETQPYPDAAWYESPEEDEQAVAPIYGDDALPMLYATYYLSCHGFHVELHGVCRTAYEGRAYEAGTYVVEMDMPYLAYGAQLREAFKVMVYVSLCGGVGGRGSESFRASYATYYCDMSHMVGMTLEVMKHGIYHACHAHGVGIDGQQFLFCVQLNVLPSYPAAVEVEVSPTHFVDEVKEQGWGIFLCDVNRP